MSFTSLRKLLSALLLVATGLVAFWIGEGFVPLISAATLLAFIALPLCVALLAPRRDTFHVRITLLVAALLFIGGWAAGQSSARKAFEECLTRGEEVRSALRDYRLQYGRFPARLADLAIKLPGRRRLRPSLWTYQLKEGDYRLSFANAQVRHVANARYPFVLPDSGETPEQPSFFDSLKP